jgi:flagellar hook protein FlgE
MMRSMFSGVSSLRVHQTRMDVIANNIANVNTHGFKSSTTTFTDAFYQRLQGASGPNPMVGRTGTNPMQVGLGVNLGSINNMMSQGASQRTDRGMDAMIQGPGFFIVGDSSGTFFTRAGRITQDMWGTLNINGMTLMGWDTRYDARTGQHVIDRSRLVPLALGGAKQNMPSEPTTMIDMAGNLDVDMLEQGNRVTRSMTFFDSLGIQYVVDVIFTFHPNASSAAPSPHSYWTFEFVREPGTTAAGVYTPSNRVLAFREGNRVDPDSRAYLNMHAWGAAPDGITAGVVNPDNMRPYGTIAFNSAGELIGIGSADRDAAGNLIPEAGPAAFADMWTPGDPDDPFRLWVVPNEGVNPSATFGDTDRRISTYGASTDPNVPGGGASFPVGLISMNWEAFSQRGQVGTTAEILPMNGNGPGTLEDVSIGRDGVIMGRYSNGRSRMLGQIPVANFRNPEGLERVGNSLWVPSANSGPFNGIGTIGDLMGGALEMSNVDLASEFTDMIVTQRGFQAASRTISVSDEMIQELVNLRR